MPEPLIFSMSQISTYIDCKKKYQLGYEMLLEPKPNPDRPMFKGTEFHKVAAYQTTQMWPHLPKMENPDVSEEAQELWLAWWQHRGITKHDRKRRVLGVESPIYVPVGVQTNTPGQDVYLRCTFDEIYLDKEGWIVGLDYKTFERDSSPDEELDFQGRIYLASLARMFPTYNIRFEYERIRQSNPGTPRGSATTLRCEEGVWWQYNKAGDKRKRAELWTVEECYATIDLLATKDEQDMLWDETKFNIMELLVRQRAAQTIPGAWGRTTNKSTCQFCYYKGLCKAELQGTLDDQTIELLANRRDPLEIPDSLKELV